MARPAVTVIICPRERPSGLVECIDSLYAHTTPDSFQLVVVQGALPSGVLEVVEEQAATLGFRLVHTPHALRPNEARILALEHVDTEWVVFSDNDVEFSDRWLDHMLDAAHELDATLVTPVITHGRIGEGKIHVAGPDYVETDEHGRHTHTIIQRHQFERLDDVRSELRREYKTDVEFHVLLARASIFDEVALEREVVSKDHTDFSRDVRRAGGKIVFEPRAVLGYVAASTDPSCLSSEDLGHYLLRFSNQWNAASFAVINEKWGMEPGNEIQSEMDDWVRMARTKGYRAVYGSRAGRLTDPRTKMLGDAIDKVLFERHARPLLRQRQAHGLSV